MKGPNLSEYLLGVEERTQHPITAVIREAECIGCTKCIQACPVDAIIGTNKSLHRVIGSECTGCELCVEPCPVDCIDMEKLPRPLISNESKKQKINLTKNRFEFRLNRLEKLNQDKIKSKLTKDRKKYINSALERVKARKAELAE